MLANGHDRRQSDRQLGEDRDKIGYVSYKKNYMLVLMKCTNYVRKEK